MSRVRTTFGRIELVDDETARLLVTAVLERAGLAEASQRSIARNPLAASRAALDVVVHDALRVALQRRERPWVSRLADLRRHTLAPIGGTETTVDRARVAPDVRLGVAGLLLAGLGSTRGAWCDVAALALAAMTAGADGLLRRELLASLRDVRRRAGHLEPTTCDLLAEPRAALPGTSVDQAAHGLLDYASRIGVALGVAIERVGQEQAALQVKSRTTDGVTTSTRATRPPKIRRHGPRSGPGPSASATLDPLLTLEDACEYLGLSRSAFYRRLADKKSGLREVARPLPGSGHLRFDRRELAAWSARER